MEQQARADTLEQQLTQVRQAPTANRGPKTHRVEERSQRVMEASAVNVALLRAKVSTRFPSPGYMLPIGSGLARFCLGLRFGVG